MNNEPRCRVCKTDKPKDRLRNWLVALPNELEGEALLENAGVWCSPECMRVDPAHKQFKDGEAFDAYDRFARAHGIDLVGALARSRGLSEEQARTFLTEGFDKGIKEIRQKKLPFSD